VLVGFGNTFIQGGGTTNPASANPDHPAVLVSDCAFDNPLPRLTYAGAGRSAIEVTGGANLNGQTAAGQTLDINGGAGCPSEARVPASFSNAGTITLGGAGEAGLSLATGGLTNRGTLVAAPTPSGITRYISGGLVNAGTLQVSGATAFDKPGAALRQTGGSTTIAPRAIFDTSQSKSIFQLQGGVLTGGGPRQSDPGDVTGPVSNTGGTVAPGSASAPGVLMFGGSYTQGPHGKFVEVIKGTSYSELGAPSMTINGTLAVTTLAGPVVGDQYTFLIASGTRTGGFSRVTGQFKRAGRFPPGWTAGYRPDYRFPHAVALDAAAAAGLRVKRAGTGRGAVTSSPAGINCGSKCTAPFFQTQTVTLTAHPASGSTFAGWSGACSGTKRTCRVKMSRARTVAATFRRAK
jgi:hypothetical protein